MKTGRYSRRWHVLERDGFTCRYCGQSAPEVRLEVDHVLPRSRGGGDELDNLVTACWSCNQGKKAHDASDTLGWTDHLRESNAFADQMVGAYREAHEAAHQWHRGVEILVSKLADELDQLEGDVWDWLLNEMHG
jgi:hypothetical protein